MKFTKQEIESGIKDLKIKIEVLRKLALTDECPEARSRFAAKAKLAEARLLEVEGMKEA